MGEANRRKQILGDSYGRQKEFSIRSYETYALELAECVSSHQEGIVRVTAQARQAGVIDGGLVVPFVISIKTGGRIMGLAYPSVGSKRSDTEIVIGLAITIITEVDEEEGIRFFNLVTKDVQYKIALAFRDWVQQQGYLGVDVSTLGKPVDL